MKRLLVALAALSCAQRNASTVTPVPLAPKPGIAVYDGDVSIDPQTSGVTARWRIAFVQGDSLTDTLRLNRGFTVAGGGATRDGDEQVITVPPRRPGVSSVDIAYAGTLVAPGDSINRISPDWIELGLDSFWQPVFARFDRAIVGRLRLTLPREYEIAASGRVTRLSDGVYQIDARVPLIDFPISAARAFAAETLGGTRVYFTGPKPALAEPVLRTSEACAAYLNALYGRPDSLPPRTMVLAPRTGPGYARKNYIVITSIDTTRVGLSRFVCHELAHFWSIRANARGPDNWLNEGFAEFIAAQYVRASIGAAAYDTIVTQWRSMGARQGPVWTPGASTRPSAMISYRKAPYLLTQLEVRLGAGKMQRVLTRYMTEPIRTTPELLGVIVSVSDSATADWFRALLSQDASR